MYKKYYIHQLEQCSQLGNSVSFAMEWNGTQDQFKIYRINIHFFFAIHSFWKCPRRIWIFFSQICLTCSRRLYCKQCDRMYATEIKSWNELIFHISYFFRWIVNVHIEFTLQWRWHDTLNAALKEIGQKTYR